MKAYWNSLKKSEPKAVLLFIVFLNISVATVISGAVTRCWFLVSTTGPKAVENAARSRELRAKIERSNDLEFLRRNALIWQKATMETDQQVRSATKNLLLGFTAVPAFALGNSLIAWCYLRALKKQSNRQSI